MPPDPHADLATALRHGMRQLPQSVTVISLTDAAGQRRAMTASSVTSVSTEPAALLVCVNRDASIYDAMEGSTAFCINALARGMEDVSNLCAGDATGDARFALGDWQTAAEHDAPFLADALVNFFCRLDGTLEYGTHRICIGRLEAVRTQDSGRPALLYVAGGYAGLRA